MALVPQSSTFFRRFAIASLIASVAFVLAALGGCSEQGLLPPVELPGERPPVDPNDPAFGRTAHVVAPDGRWENTGDAMAPWDLVTALSGAGGRVTPGDTIWIRGATYRGAFVSAVAGVPGAPVLIRALPGERVVLEHLGAPRTTLTVKGAWTTLWGIEVTNSDPSRSTLSTASEVRPNGIVNEASHTKYINLVVHDAGVGFYNYASTSDVEVYGSLFYNNGWQGPDRGHGHALYVKSDQGPVILRENVIFNQFGWGVHAYSNEGSGELNGIQIDRNVAFGNGTLADTPGAENILLGGQSYSTGSAVTRNVAWFASSTGANNVRVGFGSRANGAVEVSENSFIGGDPVLRVGQWSTAAFRGNTLAGSGRMVRLEDGTLGGYEWSGTKQLRDPLSASWEVGALAAPFLLWTTLTGLGLTDIVGSGAPTAPAVHLWPNAYEGGRAFVTVLNWAREPIVSVSLDQVLLPGDAFEIRNVQDLHGAPILTGTYTDLVLLPMTGVGPPIPIGLSSSRAPRTGPDFDVFLVVRR